MNATMKDMKNFLTKLRVHALNGSNIFDVF
jgi:hypothetical protein